MGYPMTYKRVLHRNGLHEGDYMKPPSRVPTVNWNLDALSYREPEEMRSLIESVRNWASNLAGDLRRLELDVIDEMQICGLIAERTGVEESDVAAVLKEFLAI